MLFSSWKVLIFLPIVALAWASGLCRAEGVTLDQVLEMSSKKYKEIEGFSSKFKQVVEIPLLAKRKEFRGELNYRSPNLLRLDYDIPEGGYILCDGNYFYIYLPDVDSTRVMKTFLEADPRSFLTEFFLDEARENYDAALVDSDDDDHHLTFIPKENRAELLRVDVRIARENGLVMDISYTDPSGSTTSYFLEDLKIQAEAKERFRFTLPEGVELLDLTSDPY
ncbi:MAG: outer membrane lipoprotein carrier protein LolA [Candidatus Glassbacteria bacterium]